MVDDSKKKRICERRDSSLSDGTVRIAQSSSMAGGDLEERN